MTEFLGPSVDFGISAAAKAMIATMMADKRLRKAGDSPDVLALSWGAYYDERQRLTRHDVVVGFFSHTHMRAFSGRPRMASGIPFILNIPEEHIARFDGKVLDYTEDRWFFLRDPDG